MKPEKIKKIIDREFGLDIGDKSRKGFIVQLRFIYCHIAYNQKERFSYDVIGKVVNRDHATVLNALRQFQNQMKYQDFYLLFKRIEDLVENHIENELIRREQIRTKICRFTIRTYSPNKTNIVCK